MVRNKKNSVHILPLQTILNVYVYVCIAWFYFVFGLQDHNTLHIPTENISLWEGVVPLKGNTYEHTVTISQDFQMGCKPLCPDWRKSPRKKKTPQPAQPESSNTPGSGSSHKGTRGQIGKFTAAQMEACLTEIWYYQEQQQRLRLEKMEKSQNQTAQSYGLSLATVNKWMMGKVNGLGSQLGGAQRGKILFAGEFQAIWLIMEWVWCNFYHVCMHACCFKILFQWMSDYWPQQLNSFSLVGSPLTIGRVCELAYQYAKVNNLIPVLVTKQEELGASGSRASLSKIQQSQ